MKILKEVDGARELVFHAQRGAVFVRGGVGERSFEYEFDAGIFQQQMWTLLGQMAMQESANDGATGSEPAVVAL